MRRALDWLRGIDAARGGAVVRVRDQVPWWSGRAGWDATPMPGRALLGGGGARSSAAACLPLLLLPARPLQATPPPSE